MYRLTPAGCVLALNLLMPILAAQEKVADNPAVQRHNRDIPRHQDFLMVTAGEYRPSRQVLAQAPAETKKPSPSVAELTQLATVIRPSAEAKKWQQIPWLMDVNEGRRVAKEEKRPLFLWTVFGEPLDEC